MVLECLKQAGLKINASNSTSYTDKIEYLDLWITREGVKPLEKRVKATLSLNVPKMLNRSEVCWILYNTTKISG
eukprot:7832243-Ditylum_brightwellii.AAC.1